MLLGGPQGCKATQAKLRDCDHSPKQVPYALGNSIAAPNAKRFDKAMVSRQFDYT